MSQPIPIQLQDGVTILLATDLEDDWEPVADRPMDLADYLAGIKSFSNSVLEALASVKPSELEVEFGVKAVAKSGKIISMFVEGEGEGNIRVKLSWKQQHG